VEDVQALRVEGTRLTVMINGGIAKNLGCVFMVVVPIGVRVHFPDRQTRHRQCQQ
jgi:hypothetical protein